MSALIFYQVLFGISCVANVGVGMACIFSPDWFSRIMRVEFPASPLGWERAWGATLVGLHLVYVPGLIDPIGEPWTNWSSIAIKFFMPLVFLTSGPSFLRFGLWDLGWGIVLLPAYLAALGLAPAWASFAGLGAISAAFLAVFLPFWYVLRRYRVM